MTDSLYTVRVSRSEGVVEITGPDKTWIAEQLEKFMPILLSETTSPPPKKAQQAATSAAPAGTSTSDAKPKARGRRTGGGNKSGKLNAELSGKLTNQIKTALDTYLTERSKNAKDAQSQAAVIATFLMDEVDWPEVTADDLYTVYSEMGLKIPSTGNALQNATTRKGYFSAPQDGKYRVSHKGQNFARHDSKES